MTAPTSVAELDQMSRARARRGFQRSVVLALFTINIFLFLAWQIQKSQHDLASYVDAQCHARQANVTRTNQTWSGLADIERTNPFIDDSLRAKRLALYEAAKLTLPDCGRGSK